MPVLKARCPNDASHQHFSAVAHVTEYWIVDPDGDFIKKDASESGEVVHPPDKDDVWCCIDCGAEAIFVKEEEREPHVCPNCGCTEATVDLCSVTTYDISHYDAAKRQLTCEAPRPHDQLYFKCGQCDTTWQVPEDVTVEW